MIISCRRVSWRRVECVCVSVCVVWLSRLSEMDRIWASDDYPTRRRTTIRREPNLLSFTFLYFFCVLPSFSEQHHRLGRVKDTAIGRCEMKINLEFSSRSKRKVCNSSVSKSKQKVLHCNFEAIFLLLLIRKPIFSFFLLCSLNESTYE